MKVRIAHLSDPHFGTVRPGVAEGLHASLKELAPTLILLSGDITQRARPEEFRAAQAFVESLAPTPVMAVPGNHDIPLMRIAERLFNPYGGFRRVFPGDLVKEAMIDSVQVLALNSASRWRHVQGQFAPGELQNCLIKNEKGAQVRIVAFHHPMDCAKYIDEKNLLYGRDSAMEVFSQNEVDLIVGGHIHDPFVCLSNDRYPNVERKMILGVAGTCLSWRTRAKAPNSFNLIEVETEPIPKISIVRHDIQEDFRFRPVGTRRFARDDGRSWYSVDSIP